MPEWILPRSFLIKVSAIIVSVPFASMFPLLFSIACASIKLSPFDTILPVSPFTSLPSALTYTYLSDSICPLFVTLFAFIDKYSFPFNRWLLSKSEFVCKLNILAATSLFNVIPFCAISSSAPLLSILSLTVIFPPFIAVSTFPSTVPS